MRGYVAMTAQEVQDFILAQNLEVSDIYAPTKKFIADNHDLDEEEIEYILSMVAAEDAVDMKSATSDLVFVLAFEIPEKIISDSHDMSVSLSEPLLWENLECLFEVSENGEELTWFATQEISSHVDSWLK